MELGKRGQGMHRIFWWGKPIGKHTLIRPRWRWDDNI
jgi:hypothetical protein